MSYDRSRRIVRLAAGHVKNPSTRAWLLADEHGVFEKLARDYLDKTAAKVAELGLSEEKVNDEIAVMIGLNALTAQLEHQKRKQNR